MKRTLGALAVACLLGLAAVPAAGQTTLNFSEPGLLAGWGPDPYFPGSPKGTLLSTQFAGLGATFTVANNGVAYIGAPQYVTGTSQLGWDQFLAVNSIPPKGGNPAILSLIFVDPNNGVSSGTVDGGSISVRISDADSHPSTRVAIRSYDVNDLMVEQFNLTSYQDVAVFSTGTIHRVDFIDIGEDGFVLDDLSFGSVTVAPEPATLCAMAIGAAALLIRRRKR